MKDKRRLSATHGRQCVVKGGVAESSDALITLCLISPSAISRNVTLDIYLVLISPRALCTTDTLHILTKLEDVLWFNPHLSAVEDNPTLVAAAGTDEQKCLHVFLDGHCQHEVK